MTVCICYEVVMTSFMYSNNVTVKPYITITYRYDVTVTSPAMYCYCYNVTIYDIMLLLCHHDVTYNHACTYPCRVLHGQGLSLSEGVGGGREREREVTIEWPSILTHASSLHRSYSWISSAFGGTASSSFCQDTSPKVH